MSRTSHAFTRLIPLISVLLSFTPTTGSDTCRKITSATNIYNPIRHLGQIKVKGESDSRYISQFGTNELDTMEILSPNNDTFTQSQVKTINSVCRLNNYLWYYIKSKNKVYTLFPVSDYALGVFTYDLSTSSVVPPGKVYEINTFYKTLYAFHNIFSDSEFIISYWGKNSLLYIDIFNFLSDTLVATTPVNHWAITTGENSQKYDSFFCDKIASRETWVICIIKYWYDHIYLGIIPVDVLTAGSASPITIENPKSITEINAFVQICKAGTHTYLVIVNTANHWYIIDTENTDDIDDVEVNPVYYHLQMFSHISTYLRVNDDMFIIMNLGSFIHVYLKEKTAIVTWFNQYIINNSYLYNDGFSVNNEIQIATDFKTASNSAFNPVMWTFDLMECLSGVLVEFTSRESFKELREWVISDKPNDNLRWYYWSGIVDGISIKGKSKGDSSYSDLVSYEVDDDNYYTSDVKIVFNDMDNVGYDIKYVVVNKFVFLKDDGVTPEEFDSFYYPVNKVCNVPVQFVCHSNCGSCAVKPDDKDANCLTCIDGFLFWHDTTNCVNINEDGFYLDSATETMFQCHENCETCTMGPTAGNSNCDRCKNNYHFLEDTSHCVPKPSNYYLIASTNRVYKCHDECATCTNGDIPGNKNCDSCLNIHMEWESIPGNCIEKCDDDKYYIDTTGYRHCWSSSEKCPDDFRYAFTSNGITQCLETCTSPVHCRYCGSNLPLYFTKDTCVITCPKGTRVDNDIRICWEWLPGISQPEVESNAVLYTIEGTMTSLESNMSAVLELSWASKDLIEGGSADVMTIIQSPEFTFVFYPTDSYSEMKERNMPIIDWRECEEILRTEYKIPNNETLFISQMSYDKSSHVVDPTQRVEFEVYTSSGINLDLEVCDSIWITLSWPINLNTPGLDLSEAQALEKEGIDVFNKADPVFNDKCTVFRKDGKDYTVDNRWDEVYQPISFCEVGCDVIAIDYDNNYIMCECTRVESSGGGWTSFIESNESFQLAAVFVKSTNLKMFWCYKTLVMDWRLYSNSGFVMSWSIFILTTMCGIVYFKSSHNKIVLFASRDAPPRRIKVHKVLTQHSPSYSESIPIQPDDNDVNITWHMKTKSKRIEIERVYSISLNHNPQCYKKDEWNRITPPITNENTCETGEDNNSMGFTRSFDNVHWLPTELNQLDYKSSLRYDQRTYFIHFYHIYSEKQPFFCIWSQDSTFYPVPLRINFFAFFILWFWILTALFYTEDYITESNKSSNFNVMYTWENELGKSVYASLIGLWARKIVTWGSTYGVEINNVLHAQKREGRKAKIEVLLKRLKNVNIFIFIFIEVLVVVFSYFVTVFCIWFKNNQINWLLSSWITILFNVLMCLGITLIICIFKFAGWKYKKE